MVDAAGIRLLHPSLVVGSTGEGDDVRLQQLPLLIDLDELIVILPDEPIGCGQVFVAGVRLNSHGVRAQLIELCLGPAAILAENDTGCQNVLQTDPPLHVVGVGVQMGVLVVHILPHVLRPNVCAILAHLVGDLRMILRHQTVNAQKN